MLEILAFVCIALWYVLDLPGRGRGASRALRVFRRGRSGDDPVAAARVAGRSG